MKVFLLLPVAPLVGAWIEIFQPPLLRSVCLVAPLVGAWIEIQKRVEKYTKVVVAPLVGAWIEIIPSAVSCTGLIMSLPLWERGLKYLKQSSLSFLFCRSPCGSVD